MAHEWRLEHFSLEALGKVSKCRATAIASRKEYGYEMAVFSARVLAGRANASKTAKQHSKTAKKAMSDMSSHDNRGP